LSNNSTKEITL